MYRKHSSVRASASVLPLMWAIPQSSRTMLIRAACAFQSVTKRTVVAAAAGWWFGAQQFCRQQIVQPGIEAPAPVAPPQP